MRRLPYGRQLVEPDDLDAVREVLRSDFLTTGPALEGFESALREVTGAKHAVACSSGTAALHLAALALELGRDALGITSPITFLASANCIEYCGGTVDFVDIDPDRLCLSAVELERYCREVAVPAVVIPVDLAGVPADLPAIHELGRRFGFRIVRDASHAIGSTYRFEGATYPVGCCRHADMAVFSFHPVKTVTTGEGGAVVTNDDALADNLRLFRSHGMTKQPERMDRNDGPWYYEMPHLGFNYRITDLQCALGASQLAKLGRFKARRQEIVKRYNEAFGPDERVILPPWPDGTSPCYHLYPLQFREGSEVRKRMYHRLAEQGIHCQVHYIPVHWQPYYRRKYGFAEGKCPVGETYYGRTLSIPLFPAMTDDDVELVIARVRAELG